MFKKIALAVVGLFGVFVAAVLILAASKPDTFSVQRTTSINAPPERIFTLINDFHNWRSWSPYENKDPAMKRTFSGPTSGKGAVYEWEGDYTVGKGRMEITESSPPSNVTIQLDFTAPFEGHNVAAFTMNPNADSTNVTWSMYGPNRYLGKVFSVFMDMDTMIGNDFDAGLANLKSVAENKT